MSLNSHSSLVTERKNAKETASWATSPCYSISALKGAQRPIQLKIWQLRAIELSGYRRYDNALDKCTVVLTAVAEVYVCR